MVKSQPDKIFIMTNIISPNGGEKKHLLQEPPTDGPPKIPPRMKKKGPALPEKPPHIRAKTTNPPASQPLTREPLKPRILPSTNIDRHQTTHREILVAASKAVRERPVEKRQREPAKLLMPTSGSPFRKEISSAFSSKATSPPVLDDRLKKHEPILRQEVVKSAGNNSSRKPRQQPQPILLIPRNMLPWGSQPVSYALWMQRDAAPPKGVHRKEPGSKHQPEHSSVRGRSSSVTRSGSLTSQGSSSSDSGNETFPKSVLKKQKRFSPNTTSKGSNPNRKMEQKKNVTFNAFATVQLMEE